MHIKKQSWNCFRKRNKSERESKKKKEDDAEQKEKKENPRIKVLDSKTRSQKRKEKT